MNGKLTDAEYLALSPEAAGAYWQRQNPVERKRLLGLRLERLQQQGVRHDSRRPIRWAALVPPLIALLLVIILGWGIHSCASRVPATAPPTTKAQEYPDPWTALPSHVTLTLYQAGHRCGEGYARTASHGQGEYLVYCREANGAWVTYLVFPLIDRVTGPDRAYAYVHQGEDGIPLPTRSAAAVALQSEPAKHQLGD